MKKQNSLLLTIVILVTGIFNTWAVPSLPGSVLITQPDGTSLTIVLRGDENHKVRTTIDGYAVCMNNKGFYTYAITNNLNQNVAGDRIAKDPEKRSSDEVTFLRNISKPVTNEILVTGSQSRMKKIGSALQATGFPKTGTPKSLVIMVNFSDKSFVIPTPQDAFTRLLNQSNYSDNGGTGSAKDYFQASSNGLFGPQFDVIGPYTLANNIAYYGANDVDGFDVKPAYMIVDACKAADLAGVDFTQYDTDNDGFIDNIFVYYAGYNEAEYGPENTIWPHRWSVEPGSNFTNNQSLVKFDGKTVYDYACTSELQGSTGSSMCGIGTFTHEFGHVLGLPDYYHTEADKNTLNNWHIMDAGAYLNSGRTPPTYTAYDRWFLGWMTPEQLATGANKVLYPLTQSKTTGTFKNQSYLLSATTHNLSATSPSPAEFYVMEYRKKTGWDAYLPAEGLLFWHVDYDQTAWDNNTPNNYTGTSQTASSHMRFYLQPLSGYTTTPGTAFTTGSFTPLTWAGINIERPITDITKTADSISFKVMGGDLSLLPKISFGEVHATLQFPVTKLNNIKTKYLNIKTTEISTDLTVSITGTNASLFTASVATLSMSAANSSNGTVLNIQYQPTAVGSHTAILTIQGGGLNPAKVIELKGQAVE